MVGEHFNIHRKVVFGRKKRSSVNISPKNDGFQQFLGLNMQYSHRDPETYILGPGHI